MGGVGGVGGVGLGGVGDGVPPGRRICMIRNITTPIAIAIPIPRVHASACRIWYLAGLNGKLTVFSKSQKLIFKDL